jgi:hypothetical protein
VLMPALVGADDPSHTTTSSVTLHINIMHMPACRSNTRCLRSSCSAELVLHQLACRREKAHASHPLRCLATLTQQPGLQ